jgi:hypothetical protein
MLILIAAIVVVVVIVVTAAAIIELAPAVASGRGGNQGGDGVNEKQRTNHLFILFIGL